MYCLFLYFPPAVAHNIFGAVDEDSLRYAEGIEWAGLCMAAYNAVCVGISFALPKIARQIGRRFTHALCLLCGAIGLLSLMFIHDQYLLLASMVGVGIAWASMLAMPYAMLVGSLPPRKGGIYMGIFNFFIVLPEVVASLGFGWVMVNLLHENRLWAVVVGGGSMLIAALLTLRVKEEQAQERSPQSSEVASPSALRPANIE
jgi:maltose/moltooligosaccharide transporter